MIPLFLNLLNVSFGIYAFMPQGWIFMIMIIAIEGVACSYFLRKSWKGDVIYKSIIYANIVSGIVGIIGSLKLNGGWWLVVWFPWVSENEVTKSGISSLMTLYAIAFVLSVVIEGVINYVVLRKQYATLKIWKATLLVNIISYAVGSVAMYSYSF